ncbi:GATA-binding factor A [Trichonephila inaurata madagascariensis]|uniref:GATA-binding factor A n=1 Tax=Trichonephila inaurata madagascariensis TaxID=2747483 RepID=A0A8X6Y4F7_9ARAC|nr:GATA-binding factor A [Trichonephila inaurata madagascariensis]
MNLTPKTKRPPGGKKTLKTACQAKGAPEKPWDENKNNNNPSSDSTTSWSLGNTAPQASDRTTGDVWNYQTMTSVMENGHYHPIKHSSQDDGLHPEQESYNHSESSTPPTKLVEGGEKREASAVTQPEQPPHPTAPSDGKKESQHPPVINMAVRLAAWLLTAWPVTTPHLHPIREGISIQENHPQGTQ